MNIGGGTFWLLYISENLKIENEREIFNYKFDSTNSTLKICEKQAQRRAAAQDKEAFSTRGRFFFFPSFMFV